VDEMHTVSDITIRNQSIYSDCYCQNDSNVGGGKGFKLENELILLLLLDTCYHLEIKLFDAVM
jgi:hypothetical protein